MDSGPGACRDASGVLFFRGPDLEAEVSEAGGLGILAGLRAALAGLPVPG